jgi:hypothetical protein
MICSLSRVQTFLREPGFVRNSTSVESSTFFEMIEILSRSRRSVKGSTNVEVNKGAGARIYERGESGDTTIEEWS